MDVAPKQKTTLRDKIAYLVGITYEDTAERGERANAYSIAKLAMKNANLKGSDLSNWIREGAGDGKYTEAEMQEYAQAMRKEGIEAGIKIGEARASNGGNGYAFCITLPFPGDMAEYCQDRFGQLDTKQRGFISDMSKNTRRGTRLSRKQLGYLASIYIQIGGKI